MYKSHGTLKLYVSQDVQALVHAWGFCYYTLFTSWGLSQQFQSRWLLWAHKNRWKEIRTISAWDISTEIDMMMRLTLILERDWLNKAWFWGQITCFNVYINVKGSDLYVIDIAYYAHYCDDCAHYIVLLNWSFVLSFCAYYPSPPLYV